MADNIEKQGLLQPITVRPIELGNPLFQEEWCVETHYELICGERRFRAMRRLSEKWSGMDVVAPKGSSYDRFSKIDAIVREMTDDEAFDAMITENLQRVNVDPIEEAFAFDQLIKKGSSAEDVALRFGKSVRFVQDRCKLNSLIPELMVAVKDEKMSIAAAMTISKLDEEHQRNYHSSYSNNSKGFTKETAESFCQSLFMKIDGAPWYQTDNQQDEDFEGGCGRACASCNLNTANHGCLFWEMKTEDAGKCTDRKMFYQKHCAFILRQLEEYNERLVTFGSPLETGKIVIIDTDDWCSPGAKALKAEIYKAIRDNGFEVVKSNEIFEGECCYNANDKRLKRKIEQGKVFRCLRIFQYDRVQVKEEWRYFKGGSGDDEETSKSETPATSAQSVDAMKLVQKRQRLKEIALEKVTAQMREMAGNLGYATRAGEISDAEQLAFDIILFTLCGNEFLKKRYQHKGYGKPSDREFIEVVKQNQADRPLWMREVIRNIIASADIIYNQLYQHCASLVLAEWKPKAHQEMVHAINMKLDKDLQKNAEKLRELGYDVHGKKIKTEKKADQAESVIHEATSDKSLVEQYEEMKKKHPDSILLFRVGDFYETFSDDAIAASEILGITLTCRANGSAQHLELAGFPHHALDTYLPKLVRAGKRVAICEQLQDPKKK